MLIFLTSNNAPSGAGKEGGMITIDITVDMWKWADGSWTWRVGQTRRQCGARKGDRMRGNACSVEQGHGQWARSEAQRDFYSRHHRGFHCGCPYGDVNIPGAIAVFQECRQICCDWKLSDEANTRGGGSGRLRKQSTKTPNVSRLQHKPNGVRRKSYSRRDPGTQGGTARNESVSGFQNRAQATERGTTHANTRQA